MFGVMRRETIRQQLADAEKRLAHCEQFIRRELRALDALEDAHENEAAHLTRHIIATAARIRQARRDECGRLQRELSIAS